MEICVLELTVKDALVPLKATEEAEVKFAPVIVTAVPTEPLVGEKLLMDGAAAPSTFARNTVATLEDSAVKNVSPVSAWI